MEKTEREDSLLLEFRVQVRISVADPEAGATLQGFTPEYVALYALQEGLKHMEGVGFPRPTPEAEAYSVEVVDVL